LYQKNIHDGKFLVSTGLFRAILELTARHGDVEFAEQIFKRLVGNNAGLLPAQYEALFETVASAGLVEQSLQILCQLHSLGMAVSQSHTHRLSQVWVQSANQTPAYELFTLVTNSSNAEHYQVPVAVINLLLEFCALEGEELSRVLEIFEWMEQHCSEQADIATYYYLWKNVEGKHEAQTFLKRTFKEKKDERTVRMLNLAAGLDAHTILLGMRKQSLGNGWK
jgi:hypothetical protein